MKRCRNKKCFWTQPMQPSEFNRSAHTEDGLQAYCRDCQARSNEKQRKKFPTIHKERNEAYRLKHHARHLALRRLRHRIKTGKAHKLPCEHPGCGSLKVKAYLTPPYATAVPQWFCQSHHPNKSGNKGS